KINDTVWPRDSSGSDSDNYASAWDMSRVNDHDGSFDEGSGGEQFGDGVMDVLDGA
ncbi:hypothetical protein H0H92_006893, partial [Tricholoma furcatifolium]